MTEENNTPQDSNDTVSKQREDAAVALANQFLSRATIVEALSQVSLNSLIALSQSRALQQGRDQVKDMSDEQVAALLAETDKEKADATASEAVDQVTNETAEAS